MGTWKSPWVAAVVFALSGCGSEVAGSMEVLGFSGLAMGGQFHIRLVAGDGDMQALADAAMEEARRIEGLVNAWSADSAISQWNRRSRLSPAGELDMQPELAGFVGRALGMAELTGGTFDPTVGSMLRELGFYGGSAAAKLNDANRARWRQLLGHGRVRVVAPGRVMRDVAGVELDLSAMAKGLAAEAMAQVLRAGGVTTALVSAGASSNVAFGGGPKGRGWSLELPHPDGPLTWWLLDEALSTSGQSSITLEGTHAGRSHILDPRSLEPVEHRTEMVVVRGANGADCDMLSTALLVLGVDGFRNTGGGLAPGCELLFYSVSEAGPEVVHLGARE